MNKFEHLITEIHDFLSEDPNHCINMGIEKNLGDLPNPSKNAHASRFGRSEMLKRSIKKLETEESLTIDEKIDLHLAKQILDQVVISDKLLIDGIAQRYKMPKAADEISDGIFMLYINDPRESKYRLVNIITRLEQVPGYIQSTCQALYRPVKRWVDMEIQKTQGLPDLFSNILSWAKSENFKNVERLESAINKANSSLNQYINHLRVIETTQNIHIGTEQTQHVLDSRGIELSFDQLRDIAINFLKSTSEDINLIKTRLLIKYQLDEDLSDEELQDYLNNKFRLDVNKDFNKVIERYETEKKKVQSFIDERNLFPMPADHDFVIMQTPDFLRPSIPAGAMVGPTPFREGTKKSLVYLTLSEELLDEHTEISIPAMMIHEGIPGHHLQLATAANHKSIMRKHMDAMDLCEGWTTMLEDFMLDQGYSPELKDEIRFITKRDMRRLGARVGIDLFFMTGDKKYLDIGLDADISSDDPFECAANVLKKATGFVNERVQAELNWYSQERGYPLSYLTGNYLTWALKDDFEKHTKLTGDDLHRKFHEEFLFAGNMPMKFLREYFMEKGLISP